MLTRTGWLAIAAAVGQLLVGRVLGTLELLVTGTATVLVVVGALVYVAATSLRLEVRREITPAKVHAGTPSTVELRVNNRGRHATPVLAIHDRVSGTRGVSLMLAPLLPGEEAPVTYLLPTERRGVLTVGPLQIELTDPFGIARTRTPAASSAELTVFPRVDAVSPVPHTTGDDPHAGADHPNALGRSGEDFYALRRYVVGDDLRRVHWPSTARHDDLMVRQDEVPWQSRATILLDTRMQASSDEALELSISAAASLVQACAQRQDLVRLVTADGSDSGFATGHSAFDAIMEHLATLRATRVQDLAATEALLARTAVGGALVILMGDEAAPEDALRLAALRARYGSVTTIQIDRSAWAPGATSPSPVPGALLVTSRRGFPATWAAATSSGVRADHLVTR